MNFLLIIETYQKVFRKKFPYREFPTITRELLNEEKEYEKFLHKEIILCQSNFHQEYTKNFLEICLENSVNRQKKYERCLKKEKKINTIEEAKQYPIADLIEFKGKFAKCIFHSEKSASMKYYPDTNTVYCFGCNSSADSIDVYQQIHNCSFLEAIKNLTL